MKKTDEKRAKIPFWPTKYQLLSMAAFVLGAIVGPGLVYLGFMFLEWLYPENTGGALFAVMIFILSIPLGAAAGAFLVMTIMDRKRR